MEFSRCTLADGLQVVRHGINRITSRDGLTWRAEFQAGDGTWVPYPASADADPTGGELYAEGRRVLAVLKTFT